MNELFIEKNLPKPLAKEELLECFKQMAQGNEKSRNKIIVHNIKLVLSRILTRFSDTPYDKNELVSIGIIGLIKSVDTFDMNKKNNFSTYAVNCIDNEILMFIRKGKRYINETSLDASLEYNQNETDLNVLDLLLEENDFSEDIIEKIDTNEIINIIYAFIESLPSREKNIIEMYFGLNGKKHCKQKEIADIIGISRSAISRIITQILNELKIELYLQKYLNRENISVTDNEIEKYKRKRANKMAKKVKSIYEIFNKYTKEEVNQMLEKLTDEEKNIINLKYGNDLEHPVTSELWTKEHNSYFFNTLKYKMKKLLANPNFEYKQKSKQAKKLQEDLKVETSTLSDTLTLKSVEKTLPTDMGQVGQVASAKDIEEKSCLNREDYIGILELLKSANFSEMLQTLSVKEAVIISLKLGYIDGKYFSTKTIADFLKISEEEVIETTKKVLLIYKEKINSFLDNAIRYISNDLHR